MTTVKNISYAVSPYSSHPLSANVKFSDIEKISQSMKTDPSIIYMVPDQKQTKCRLCIMRDRLIIMVKRHYFVGIYVYKVES